MTIDVRTSSNACAAAALTLLAAVPLAAAADADLLDLSLEELAELPITTVSRVEEPLIAAPAAVFVITGDAIKRSGVTSIAEALRLAPGVEVARRNSHSWSISIRGFNSDLANKLLVLIDGRSVYSPLYAGVFWDVQDTLLEDVDRIEVIAGPGGTLWGANAVNGVINIITRPAAATAGAFVELGGGNEDQAVAGFRYGGTFGNGIAARSYAKFSSRDATQRLDGSDGIDDAQMLQAGFRMDWSSGSANRFTVQGDVYDGEEDGLFLDAFTVGTLPAGSSRGTAKLGGANVLARWERNLDNGDFALQTYYDYTRRDIPNTYDEKRDTLDVDFQHHFPLGSRHDMLWGAAVRFSADELENTALATFEPDQRDDRTTSVFLQDRIELKADRLFLTLGAKFEDNDYTDWETQPSVRLSWMPTRRQAVWSAVSRAVRIPARLDSDLRLTLPLAAPGLAFPVYVTADGNPRFRSEELEAYEAGYRIQVNERLAFDLSAFHNVYDHLQTVEPGAAPIIVLTPPGPYAILPQTLENLMEGDSSGATLAATWQPRESWRLQLQYTRFDLDLAAKPGSADTIRPQLAGNSPDSQVAVRSYVDLPHDLKLYVAARYVDDLPNQGVDSYTAVDASLGWSPTERLTASISGQNLNDARHVEFGEANQIERSALLRLLWTF